MALCCSRALGGFDYKCVHGKGPTGQLVSPEPDVRDTERSEEDGQFIILACDGIWNVMGKEELCDFLRSRLEVTDDLEKVCNEVVDTSLYEGRRDNVSVIWICFPNAPNVLPEAEKKEAELDKYLESRVEEIMEKQGEGVPDLVHVMRTLASENIPSLPPGGELASKRNIIKADYNGLNPYKNDDTDSTSTEDCGKTARLAMEFTFTSKGEYGSTSLNLLTFILNFKEGHMTWRFATAVSWLPGWLRRSALDSPVQGPLPAPAQPQPCHLCYHQWSRERQDGRLWQEPEKGPPRTHKQGTADIAASPVQSERLVEAPPPIPGSVLGHVCDPGLSHVGIFIPMLPGMWKYIAYGVSFYWHHLPVV
ncbi:hypothetical protein QTO34_018326 [Cnephaeus nilssonii]|uniref:protein-serine/threonine phosphatase n=1 Tax=Cnephaeus nilssonii TaxID=3371016 RepID=A0AA40HZG3_CNENI|nr:hypothetical protein QTO34_018326 [Eptesicus nilssonii]